MKSAAESRRVQGDISYEEGAPVRVLVVDDEETIRVALSRFLSSRGYEVQTAADASEALMRLRREPFAAMLCDVRMPGMSGVELVPHALAVRPQLAITILSAVNDASTATEALSSGAYDYLTKPIELRDLHRALERALVRRAAAIEREQMERMIRAEVAERTMELEREKTALRNLSVSTVETLVNAQEAKDIYLRGHSQRVADLAAAIARELGIDEEGVRLVHLAGRLHDVGKIGIREEVLNKPSRLTDEEFTHVKEHVRIGVEILKPLAPIIGEALDYVRDHHERWAGGGYPRGVCAEAICLGGRILAAADSFDALTSQRAYRDPLTAVATLEFLGTQVGSHLDPRVFAALERVWGSSGVLPNRD